MGDRDAPRDRDTAGTAMSDAQRRARSSDVKTRGALLATTTADRRIDIGRARRSGRRTLAESEVTRSRSGELCFHRMFPSKERTRSSPFAARPACKRSAGRI